VLEFNNPKMQASPQHVYCPYLLGPLKKSLGSGPGHFLGSSGIVRTGSTPKKERKRHQQNIFAAAHTVTDGMVDLSIKSRGGGGTKWVGTSGISSHTKCVHGIMSLECGLCDQ